MHAARLIPILLPLGGLTSCGLFAGSAGGPERVNDLVGWVERVQVDAELSQQRAHQALGSLHAIVDKPGQGDPVAAYQAFVASIEESEEQAARLRSNLEPMKASAEPLFSQWQGDLDAYHSTGLRQLSARRLEDTRARFDAIVVTLEPTLETFDSFNKGLRDHALFLGNDFNPQSLAVLQDDLRALDGLLQQLDAGFGRTQVTAREYAELAALPAPGGAELAAPGH